VSLLRKHNLMSTAFRASLFGINLKFLDKLKRWVPHTGTCKNVLVELPHSPDLNDPDSYMWGHLKPLGYSDPIEKEGTLHQHILMHDKPFQTAPLDPWKEATVHDETCPCVNWLKRRKFWASIVNCNLISDKNSTVIELEKCIVNLLDQLSV
jgi:hypothetical protein